MPSMTSPRFSEMPEQRRQELAARHAALAAKIEKLEQSPGADDLEIHHLKKQKLALKDALAGH